MSKKKFSRRQFTGMLSGALGVQYLLLGLPVTVQAGLNNFSSEDETPPQVLNDVLIDNLRCEYLINPLGIDETKPRFNWMLSSDRRKTSQTAYQVIVASSARLLEKNNPDLWDSGKVISGESIQIEYSGKPLQSRMSCFWKVKIWDEKGRASAWSKKQCFTMGLLSPKDWQAAWIGVDEPALLADKSKLATPRYLRKQFITQNPIRRATVYATALGLYELRINGKRVGDHLLTPEWTSYFKRIQYQTYDVTNLLQKGNNAIAATLGNGWYCGFWQHWPPEVHIYGNQPYLKVQLEIEFANGEKQMIHSDDTWSGTINGPLRFTGIYEGETYDARMEMPGWDEYAFDDSKWQKVFIGENLRAGKLVWQKSQPIRITQDIASVKLTEPFPKTYVFDLGQNIAGRIRFAFKASPGQTIILKFNEVLNKDGTVYMDNLHAGFLSTGDRQTIHYTFKGNAEEIFEPQFTYQGFRYIQVEGLTERPEQNAITGRVFHTDCPETGSFSCSNDLVNKLVKNIQWSQRANFMGVPTDCPQRDERCGYTGDAQFFVPTAIYNMDIAAFFSKWLTDVCEDSQDGEGFFYDHAPFFGAGVIPSVGWSDAGIICPYIIYRTYGDLRIIRNHYAAMKRNLEWQIKTSHGFTRGPESIGNGDWLNQGGGASNEVIATSYYGYDCRLMAEMAEAIGEHEDAAVYKGRADKIKSTFAQSFINEDGSIRESSQTGYALAYTMGLVPKEKQTAVAGQFVKEIARFNNHLATGFIGTPRLLPALHEAGRDDIAYKLLLNETVPSWLYPVTMGATTVWERWDGYTKENGFQDAGMNSFNHYAFGSVGQYLFGQVGGIQEQMPGYKHIIINPVIEDGLTWATTGYQSILGEIACAWKKDSSGIHMDIIIPANTSATVYIPAMNIGSITESGKAISQTEDFRVVNFENGKAVIELGSGSYKFISTF